MEVAKAPPITFAIENFLQNDAITMIGGLPGAGKTWMMLSMAKALLDGTPLFGFEDFKVATPAEKVVYLCPESSLTPFAARLKLFGLDKHVRGPGHGSLFCGTISVDSENLLLTDLRLHHAVDGAHVFLDTATRFMTGDENSAGEQREFSRTLFQLLQAGAKTVTAAHHAPKGAEHIAADKMTLESVLRGTGELGAMVATCFALKMTDSERTRIHVKHVKYRDIDRIGDFALEGKPWIDQTGDLKMVASPGMAVAPTVEKRNKHAEQVRKAMTMKTRGHSVADIAGHFGVQERTVFRWLSEDDIPDIPVS
jgi:AAA domain/Homeodomain-like domain